MSRNILVLCQPFSLQEKAVQYSIELAKRTAAGLVFLLILSPGGEQESMAIEELERKIQQELGKGMALASEAGVSAQAVMKMGEPASELMKFLAESGHVQAVVWAGGKRFSDKKELPRDHWLSKVRRELNCPLVIPSAGSQTGEGDKKP